jgi:hypothetical protein
MCKYFQYSRAAYYNLEMVRSERRLQPRLGGKKLYFMLQNDIHKIDPHFGRDKFFDLLRDHKLLVERKQKYCKTTNSWHHFHKYKNLAL